MSHDILWDLKKCVRGRISKSAKMSLIWLLLSTVTIYFAGVRLAHATILPLVSSFLRTKIRSPYLTYSSSCNKLFFNCKLDQIYYTWSSDLETPRNPLIGVFIKCKFCNSCQLLMYCLDKMTINYIDFHH